ncbi:acyl-CoA dehydratase activase [Chloroflexota bacterium]
MKNNFLGLDIGSTMTKVVVLNSDQTFTKIVRTGAEHRILANQVVGELLADVGVDFKEVTYVVSTGYGRLNVPFADRQITEITCHARGVEALFPGIEAAIDIGGQDCKAIKMNGGKVVDFIMNDKCAAGTGRFLEIMAESLGVSIGELGELSLHAERALKFNNICSIFIAQETLLHRSSGASLEDIAAGIHQAIATKVCAMAERVGLERGKVVLTGGGAKNMGLVKAMENKLGFPLLVPEEPLLTGALGAALLAKRHYEEAMQEGKPLATKERILGKVSIFT